MPHRYVQRPRGFKRHRLDLKCVGIHDPETLGLGDLAGH